MKRKCICVVMALLVLCQCLVTGLAADPVPAVKILSAYWQNGMLYTFAQFADEKPESLDAELMLNNMQTGRTKPKTISSPDAAVHYLLLVDTSTSMLLYRKKLQDFAQALMETEQNVKISLAGFDGKLTMEKENMTTWAEVKSAIGKLSFSRDGSDINGSVAAAMEYLGAKGYTAGDLPNVVVITDGEAWYDNNRAKEKQKEDQANQTLAAAMKAYPEIIVHSYCTDKWNENVYGTLSKGKGLHLKGKSAKEVGEQIAAFSDSVYTVFFPLQGNDNVPNFIGQLTLCVGNSYTSYGTVRNAAVAPEIGSDGNKDDIPDDTTVPETTEATVPETTDATEGTEGTESTEGTNPADTSGTQPTQTSGSSDPTDTTGGGGKEDPDRKAMLIAIGGAAAAVVVLIVVIILIAGKQRKRKNAIRICVEFVTGGNGKNVYYLSRELLIGSDKNCDIRVPGSGAAARIFVQGQMIYVEDMGAQGGTALNGMRIFSSNRLRSGDEIAVGSVRMRVLF